MYTKYTEIIVKIEERVATVTFNRPQLGNAFSLESYSEIADVMQVLGKDENVGAVVLTGEGKHFSAGGDIKRFKELIETKQYIAAQNVNKAGEMGLAIRRCPKPVIAMINGAAAGAGCSVALACDFRFVSPKSKMIMSFVNIGLSGDTGGMYYLQRLVGSGKTIEMMMSGAAVGGEEAVALGLATRLAAAEELEAETYAFAKEMAAKPLVALRHQKELLNEFFYANMEAYTAKEVEYMVDCSRSNDFAEAVDAFLEKRAPKFTGR